MAVAILITTPVWAADGDTTVGGALFTDLTTISTTQDTATGSSDKDPNGIGLDVTRGYLIVNHGFDDVWSFNLTTDFNFPKLSVKGTDSTGGTVTSSGSAPETQVFIKKAYVQGKFSDLRVLRVGSADTPWAPYVDGVYGYRFVEKTLTDKYGFANTADWGVNLSGGNSLLSYSTSLVNGGGFRNPSRSKGMDFEGRVAFTPLDGALVVAAGLYSGKRGLDTEAAPAVNTARRTDLLVAWKAAGLTVGLEWFSADKWNDVMTASGLPTTRSDGSSVFGSYDLPGTDFSVFGRYDDVKPAKDTFTSLEEKYYNAGFAWKTSKNITWALAYKSNKLTDNLKLGNTTDALKTQEFGVWAQIKF
ncbi:MAG TPA: carbohydrate porin [Gammaproteobacteria bacterium]|nr:carbohydrate porin [Gammaproteobacteria bacterium]